MSTMVEEITKSSWNKGLTSDKNSENYDPRIEYKRPTAFKKGSQINLGRHHSAESIKKMSDAKKGKKRDPEATRKTVEKTRGQKRSKEFCERLSKLVKKEFDDGTRKSWNKGKHLSREHRLKIGLANRGAATASSLGWSGKQLRHGYTYEFNKELKETIRARDKFTCFMCGESGKAVHHIDYDKENNSEDNLITLCPICHGKTNFNRDSWMEFFK